MDTFPLGSRFLEALRLAHEWHTGQYRKGTGTAYVSHLLGVASVALEYGATEDEAIAALLHDALEDGPENLQPVREERAEMRETLQRWIADAFGPAVTALVVGATETTPLVDGRKAPWAERKGAYLRRLVDGEHPESASALLVSASDKLHNARSILGDVLAAGPGPHSRAAFFSRFTQGLEGTLQYYRLLVDAYRAAPGARGHARLGQLVDELDRTVTALEAACGVRAEDVRSWAPLRAVISVPPRIKTP